MKSNDRPVIFRNGKLYPNKQNLEGARKYIATLRQYISKSQAELSTLTDPARLRIYQNYISTTTQEADWLDSRMPA